MALTKRGQPLGIGHGDKGLGTVISSKKGHAKPSNSTPKKNG